MKTRMTITIIHESSYFCLLFVGLIETVINHHCKLELIASSLSFAENGEGKDGEAFTQGTILNQETKSDFQCI